MRFDDIPVPEVYTDSADFRFFLKWFAAALERTKYDTENLFDLYDALRCPADLLWMLGDTMGYKYDDRLPTAFNRLVLLYFMSMIRNKGSKDGMILAGEVNLKQFDVLARAEERAGPPHLDDILYDRLEDTSIPVNSVYVTPHVAEGYIDLVYFSEERPIDACTEYVRPLGMYLFQTAGVRFDARTKICVDARLTNTNELHTSIGPTHVGHYTRDDYARMQRLTDEDVDKLHDGAPYAYKKLSDKRQGVWYRNSEYEDSVEGGGDGQYGSGTEHNHVNPGYRALYSLQISNNEHIFKSLLPEIFSIGYGPQNTSVEYADDYLKPEYQFEDHYSNGSVVKGKPWNLRYDRATEEGSVEGHTDSYGQDIWTVDNQRGSRRSTRTRPLPAVNPMMSSVGDAIAMNDTNTKYTKNTGHGIEVQDADAVPDPNPDIQSDTE